VYVGLFGCEIWLWVRHRDGYLASWFGGASECEYLVVTPPPPSLGGERTEAPPLPRALHVRRQFRGTVRIVSWTPAAERNTVVITCALPHSSLLLAVPPGHHMNISLLKQPDGTRVWRPYSPLRSSTPGMIRFLVRHVPNGRVSPFIAAPSLEAAAQGDSVVALDGPHGGFHYTPSTYHRIGLVAGGSGLAPLLSVAQTALDDPLDSTVFTLLCCNTSEADIPLGEELATLAAAHPLRFKLHHALSRPNNGAVERRSAAIEIDVARLVPPVPTGSGKAPTRGEFYSKHIGSGGVEAASSDAPCSGGQTLHVGRPTVELLTQVLPVPDEYTQVLVCGQPRFNRSILSKLSKLGHSAQRTFGFGTSDR